jgi:hypothetical protein
MVSMEYKFTEMAKSLLARIFAVALVISLIAGGLAHAEVPSCLIMSQGTRTLDSGVDQSGTFKIAKVDKEVGGATMSHAANDSGSQSKFQCCDKSCPSLFTNSGASTTSSIGLRRVHVIAPRGSILTARAKGLERPPKTLFTY